MKYQTAHYGIRPATAGDTDVVKKIIFTVLEEYGLPPEPAGKDSDLNDLQQHYFLKNGFFGVVVDRAAGQVVGTFGLSPVSEGVCELRKMYLRKECRGQGLGTFMLNTALEIAKEKGYRKVMLETISPLREAIALYRKFGFVEVQPAEVNARVDQAFVRDV